MIPRHLIPAPPTPHGARASGTFARTGIVAKLNRPGIDGGSEPTEGSEYPDELRDRAVRLVMDVRDEAGSLTAACQRVGEQLGINRDTLRGWAKQAEIDAGARPGVSTADAARIKALERENAELRRANAILRTASAFFAAELDRH